MTRRRRLWYLAGIIAATSTFLIVIPGRRGWFDARVYYGTVHAWVYGGGHIYDYVVPGTRYGFTYPPFAAVGMLPLAFLSCRAAIAATVALSVLAAAAVLYLLIDPIAIRRGWNRWFAFAVAGCLFAAYGPVRDTVSFGQVNLVLLAVVLADQRLLVSRGHWFAGIGIGLAAAIKLTPAIFICYLLLRRKLRAAAVATTTTIAVTLLAVVLAPDPSRVFWTHALWDTGRVGSLSYVSNQSLMGLVARLDPVRPDELIWVAGVAFVLSVWAYRVWRADASGDGAAAFALTCITAVLVSPVTWVHHLVWLIPPLVVLVDTGLRGQVPRHRRAVLLLSAGVAYAVLSSSVVWLWSIGPDRPTHPSGVSGFLGSNAFVWIGLALLCLLPRKSPPRESLPRVQNRHLAAFEKKTERAESGDHPAKSPSPAINTSPFPVG